MTARLWPPPPSRFHASVAYLPQSVVVVAFVTGSVAREVAARVRYWPPSRATTVYLCLSPVPEVFTACRRAAKSSYGMTIPSHQMMSKRKDYCDILFTATVTSHALSRAVSVSLIFAGSLLEALVNTSPPFARCACKSTQYIDKIP